MPAKFYVSYLRLASAKAWLTKLSTTTEKFLSYVPTPPLGQDMTQGQFLCGV